MEVLLDDHILDRVHGCFQQSRVRSVCVMNVDFTFRHPVDAAEAIGEIFGGRFEIRTGTSVVREMFGDRRHSQFPLKKVHLIEEQDDGLLLEPFTVCQGLEEHHSFVHLVLIPKSSVHVGKENTSTQASHSPHSGPQASSDRIQTTPP